MGRLSRVVALLRSSHFQPTLAVTAISTALALSAGRGTGTAWVALAVLAGQVSVGWSNDYLDCGRDRLAGRRDKPIVAGEVSARVVGTAALVAAALCVPLSLLSGWRAALVHLGAVAVAWAYNAGIKATAASPLPYALAFGALPAFITLGLPGHPWPPAWSVLAAALLGCSAHFVNTLPDLVADDRVGVRGLPHRIGPTRSILVAALLMGAAAVVVAVSSPDRVQARDVLLFVVALVGVGAVVTLALAGRGRASWSATLAVAVLTVAMFVARADSLA